MSLSDWYITGSGGQSIVNYGGSKRCQLSGSKLMLWSGRNDLASAEIIASILMGVDTNTRGGLVLRSDLSGLNQYRLRVFGQRTYYVQKIVTGVVTTLATIVSPQPYNIFVKTRFRVDAYQLSVEEFISGSWNLVTVIVDSEQSLGLGYVGLYGESINTGYALQFDDVEIAERT